jgi:competence ComEA-like helix-hairpin-helix protein
MKTTLSIIITLTILPPLFAQDSNPQNLVEREIERILEEIDPEESADNPEEFIRRIHDLAANPVNINRAGVSELMEIPGMSMGIAAAMISYREEVKPFESVSELIGVRGIGQATLDKISPFVTVGNRAERRRDVYLNPRTWTHNGRFDTFSRYQRPLQTADGYKQPDSLGGYLGNPATYYQRFNYRSRHISMNITQQKRAGERFTSPVSMNHNSFHLGVQHLGWLRQLIAGHFNVRFGQGLILRSGSVFGKGRDVIGSPSVSGPVLRGHTSAQTAGAFRGIAGSAGNRIQVTGFYSTTDRTASVVNGDTIRFPANTVEFTTRNNLEKANNTRQETAGGRFSFESSALSMGINGYYNRFSRPVQSGNQPYQLYAFEGTTAYALSADLRVRFQNLTLFGEAGTTGNNAYGLISGVEISSGFNTDMVFSYRQYSPRFQAIFGGSFSEQSGTPRNEEGFYAGVRHQLSESIRVSAFYDQYRFPSPRFRVNQPSSGRDWFGLIEYRPDSDTELYFQLRRKSRDEEIINLDLPGRPFAQLALSKRTNLRLHLTRQVHPDIRIRSRAELVSIQSVTDERSLGYLIYQDIRLQPWNSLRIDARVTFFDTDDFHSRLYHFENDLLYLFSSTMLFGRGQRMYLLFNYRPSDHLQIWFKASTTLYENQSTIGSGRNRIQGNIRSDIGVQVRVRI